MNLQTVPTSLDETILRGTASSGLSVIVNPRPGFVRTFAAFGTNFGSIDRVSGPGGEPVPEGLAHFLEHKLFEDARGDVSDRFSEMGASTNAMTAFVSGSDAASGPLVPSKSRREEKPTGKFRFMLTPPGGSSEYFPSSSLSMPSRPTCRYFGLPSPRASRPSLRT